LKNKAWLVMDNSRIGRLRCIAYDFGIFLIFLPLLILSGAFIWNGFVALGLILSVLATLGITVLNVLVAIRRLHDMNASGWWSIVQIPIALLNPNVIEALHLTGLTLAIVVVLYLVIVLYALVLMLMPGTADENRFGPPPVPNSSWVKAGATAGIAFPFMFFAIAVTVSAIYAPRPHETSGDASRAEHDLTVQEVPGLVHMLAATKANGNYVVVMFVPAESTDGVAVNMQWSIEKDQLGLDWVLLSPRNIADQDKLKQFIEAKGFHVANESVNDVQYLRVEGFNTTNLGMSIMKDFYGLKSDSNVGVIIQGFDLP